MTDSGKPVYFVGCDMGGWHNKDQAGGDALAVCRWTSNSCTHVEATAALTLFPIDADNLLHRLVDQMLSEEARIVVCIDAAFSWPERFRRMIAEVPSWTHSFDFELIDAINNPYLYRETDRFVKTHVFKNKNPLTAVGDKFGNNSSKAQSLVQWFRDKLPDAYLPPFHGWDREKAAGSLHSILEVYPAASMRSKAFKKLVWPPHRQSMEQVGSSDIADAKRCAITGMCYANDLHIISSDAPFPSVWMPDEANESEICRKSLKTEGWIFSPKII